MGHGASLDAWRLRGGVELARGLRRSTQRAWPNDDCCTVMSFLLHGFRIKMANFAHVFIYTLWGTVGDRGPWRKWLVGHWNYSDLITLNPLSLLPWIISSRLPKLYSHGSVLDEICRLYILIILIVYILNKRIQKFMLFGANRPVSNSAVRHARTAERRHRIRK